MFGYVIPGRSLQTVLTQVDETHAYFDLGDGTGINHICVFLLGTVPFPDGYGATVHFFWPGKGFQLLGMLSNDKPSAIFRLRGTFTSTGTSDTAQAAFGGGGNVLLGFAVAPLEEIMASIPSGPSATAAPSSVPVTGEEAARLAEAVGRHMVNYVSGFAGPDGQVAVSVVGRWFDAFLAKVRAAGVGFLERAGT